jgi:hypothetical protein
MLHHCNDIFQKTPKIAFVIRAGAELPNSNR